MSMATLGAGEMDGLLAALKSADGVFCVDSDQRISHWSDSASQILGYAAAEVSGRPCYDVIGGRDAQDFGFCRRNCPVVTNARRGRTTADYDVLVRDREGADRWINMSVLLLKTQRRRSPQVLHLFRDVTERRRVEALARRALDALREMAPSGPAGEEPAGEERPHAPLPSLSRRESQVLRLLAAGVGTQQMAENLGISPITARNHVTRLIAKLGVRNRLEAVLYASRNRLI